MEDIIKKIREVNDIVVFVHENPDGDAIGSITALTYALHQMGKNVQGFIEFIPANFEFLLNGNKLIKTYEDINMNKSYELCIVIDSGDINRIGKAVEVFENSNVKINIDHHITNTLFGDLNYVDSQASSAGEIVFELINMMRVAVDGEIARYLYTSIISDTGMFRFSNTTPKTFEMAGELLKTGIDTSLLAHKVFFETSFERTKCLGKVLESLEMYENGKIGILSIENDDIKDFEVDAQDLEGMVDYARNIRGSEVGIFIKPKDNEFKVSLRSNGKVNVAEVAEKFGGGGHICAAGCRFRQKTVKEIKDILTGVFKELV